MHAIILLGGQGTRMRESFPGLVKALIPVLDKPFIQWQLEQMIAQGVTSVHLAAGYQAEQIDDWTKQQSQFDIPITVISEPEPRGTAGAIKYLEDHITTEPFFVLNGDTLVPHLHFKDMWQHHQQQSFQATIAITPIDEAGRYGTVEFTDDGCIKAFREKTERKAGHVNAGVYLLHKALLQEIPQDKPQSIEHDIFPMLCENQTLGAFVCDPPLLDMGTPTGLKSMEHYLTQE